MYVCMYVFIHSFSIDLLQDMEIVIFIIMQEKKTKQQHTVYMYINCKKFVSVV
jgi:hypothetical protein